MATPTSSIARVEGRCQWWAIAGAVAEDGQTTVVAAVRDDWKQSFTTRAARNRRLQGG
jgi:hypothetical protein